MRVAETFPHLRGLEVLVLDSGLVLSEALDGEKLLFGRETR